METYNLAKEQFIKVLNKAYPSEIHNGYIFMDAKEIVSHSNHWNHYIPLSDFIDLVFINDFKIGAVFMAACTMNFMKEGTLESEFALHLSGVMFGSIPKKAYMESPWLFMKYMICMNHYSPITSNEGRQAMIDIYIKNNSFGALRSIKKAHE